MCTLRVSGTRFDPDAFLRESRLEPCMVFHAGQRKSAESVWKTFGFNVPVSDASWEELQGQVAEACAFLDRYADEIRTLRALDTVEDIWLDFPLNERDVAIQCDYFPPEFVQRAGALGLGLEISIYPPDQSDLTEPSGG